MSLRKIDGELDLERIGDYDPLSWMDEDAMKRHIAKVFAEVSASGADMDRIAMAFLGPELHGRRERLLLRLRNPRPMTQEELDAFDRLELYPKQDRQDPPSGGGTMKKEPSRTAVDPLLLDVMELGDTMKDFAPARSGGPPVQERVDYIEWSMRKDPSVPIALPSGTINEFTGDTQLDIMDVARTNTFVKYMFGTEHFLFGDEYVKNPLFERNFSKGGAIIKKGADLDTAEAKDPPCEDCFVADLYNFTDPGIRQKGVWLEQLSSLCKEIRFFFWKRNTAFVCDTPSYLVKVLLNLKVCANFFADKYSVEYRDTRRGVQVFGLADIIKELNEEMVVNYTTITCDAALMDPADHNDINVQLDPRPTGQVFHEGAVAKVELIGARVKTEVDDSVPVDSESESDGEDPAMSKVYEYDYTVSCLRDGVHNVVTKEDSRTSSYSTASMGKIVSDQCKLRRYTEGGAVNFALKRAGDWGMIAYCAKYDRAFVTTDKLAAMAARLKGVCVLYLNDHKSTKPVLVRRHMDSDVLDEQNVMQYTFSLCGTFRERDNLEPFGTDVLARIAPVPPRFPKHKGGAHGTTSVIALVCAALIVSMLVA